MPTAGRTSTRPSARSEVEFEAKHCSTKFRPTTTSACGSSPSRRAHSDKRRAISLTKSNAHNGNQIRELNFVTQDQQSLSRKQRIDIRRHVLIVSLILVALLVAPIGTSAQTQTPTPVLAPALSLSQTSGRAGSRETANGVGFRPSETVNVTFNGENVGQPTVPAPARSASVSQCRSWHPGTYGVLAVGRASGSTASASYTIKLGAATLSYDPPEAAPGNPSPPAEQAFSRARPSC